MKHPIKISIIVLLGIAMVYLIFQAPQVYYHYKNHQKEKSIEAQRRANENKKNDYLQNREIAYGIQGEQYPYLRYTALEEMYRNPNHTPEDIYNLALCYWKGEGIEEDHKKAMILFNECYSKKEITTTMKLKLKYAIACIYAEQKDYEKVTQTLHNIIDTPCYYCNAYYEALNLLAAFYYTGTYYIQSTSKAIELWEDAAGGKNTNPWQIGSNRYVSPYTAREDSIDYINSSLRDFRDITLDADVWSAQAAKYLYEYYQAFNKKSETITLYTLHEAKKWQERYEAIIYCRQKKKGESITNN